MESGTRVKSCLIVGEPGVGKSTLIRNWLKEMGWNDEQVTDAGGGSLWRCCRQFEPYSGKTPFKVSGFGKDIDHIVVVDTPGISGGRGPGSWNKMASQLANQAQPQPGFPQGIKIDVFLFLVDGAVMEAKGRLFEMAMETCLTILDEVGVKRGDVLKNLYFVITKENICTNKIARINSFYQALQDAEVNEDQQEQQTKIAARGKQYIGSVGQTNIMRSLAYIFGDVMNKPPPVLRNLGSGEIARALCKVQGLSTSQEDKLKVKIDELQTEMRAMVKEFGLKLSNQSRLLSTIEREIPCEVTSGCFHFDSKLQVNGKDAFQKDLEEDKTYRIGKDGFVHKFLGWMDVKSVDSTITFLSFGNNEFFYVGDHRVGSQFGDKVMIFEVRGDRLPGKYGIPMFDPPLGMIITDIGYYINIVPTKMNSMKWTVLERGVFEQLGSSVQCQAKQEMSVEDICAISFSKAGINNPKLRPFIRENIAAFTKGLEIIAKQRSFSGLFKASETIQLAENIVKKNLEIEETTTKLTCYTDSWTPKPKFGKQVVNKSVNPQTSGPRGQYF